MPNTVLREAEGKMKKAIEALENHLQTCVDGPSNMLFVPNLIEGAISNIISQT